MACMPASRIPNQNHLSIVLQLHVAAAAAVSSAEPSHHSSRASPSAACFALSTCELGTRRSQRQPAASTAGGSPPLPLLPARRSCCRPAAGGRCSPRGSLRRSPPPQAPPTTAARRRARRGLRRTWSPRTPRRSWFGSPSHAQPHQKLTQCRAEVVMLHVLPETLDHQAEAPCIGGADAPSTSHLHHICTCRATSQRR